MDNVESVYNYMIRIPKQNHLAHSRDYNKNRLAKFYLVLIGMIHFQVGSDFLDHRCLAVRLEDVKHLPKETLTSICQFIGLEFSESMMVTTQFGHLWHRPPSLRNPDISGFSSPSKAPAGYRLSHRDRAIFSRMFEGMRSFMSYNQSDLVADEKTWSDFLLGTPLDCEQYFAERMSISSSELASDLDFRSFRRSAEYLLGRTEAPRCGLAVQRLINQ
jgi:hypothetical protein